jgi:hypothetical protein
MRGIVAAVFVLSSAVAGRAQDHEGCPMAGHRAAVDHRHQQATGVPTDGSAHHFALSDDGGSIRLEASGADQAEARDHIRAHLRMIARAFAEGDFSMPTRIHDQVPPGLDVMKARRDAIRYAYADLPAGGSVTITTHDPEALVAVHAFLRFQIADHGTGDPAE